MEAVGTRVAKRFGGVLYRGTVDAYDVQAGYWHVAYDDGDEEEMDEGELEEARWAAVADDGKAGAGRPPKGYKRLGFTAFVAARQAILEARRRQLPREQWTGDFVLQRARFCNINRADDATTAELLGELRAHPQWSLRERVLLCAALRFTGSRRGEAAGLAALVEAGRDAAQKAGARKKTPLCAALAANEVRCGAGTYQLSLNRKQVASVIEAMATAVVARVNERGPFADVLEASDAVADLMTVGKGRKAKRPQFSANETAKDFGYLAGCGIMEKSAHHRCRLGPGAKKGLALVRLRDTDLADCSEEDAVRKLRTKLHACKAGPSLTWVAAIDVEQALCEFAKYEAYCTSGISAGKRFAPHQLPCAGVGRGGAPACKRRRAAR